MSEGPSAPSAPVRAPDLREWKRRGRKIVMLTAYDAAMARLLDEAGVDVLLVGDSLGMVMLGHRDTIAVTLEQMIHHARAVSRVVRRPLVVADMPFLTYQTGLDRAAVNAGRLLQEGGAAAVKIEGGGAVVDVAARLVEIGIPVMGHLGLTPQSVHRLGGFRRQATTPAEVSRLVADARALEQAGVFALVLESIPAAAAAEASRALEIPTIGIGAGPRCDGQVLVSHDMLGLVEAPPPFAKTYARLGEAARRAFEEYAADVRDGRFPEPEPRG